jgi:hypothetical protein
VVLVHIASHPAAACILEDLSEGGCQCKLAYNTIEPSVFNDWRTYLVPGVSVDLDISKLPHLNRWHVRAMVAHPTSDAEGNIDVGFVFVDLSSEQQELLRKALLAVAVDKVRPIGHPPPPPPPPTSQAGEKRLPHERFAGKSLSEVIVLLQMLTSTQAAEAESFSKKHGMSLSRYLIQKNLLTPVQVCRALAMQGGLAVTNLKNVEIPEQLKRLFTYLTMLQNEFIPFAESKELLCIAAAQPLSSETLNDLGKHCPKPILVFLAPLDQIREHLFKLRPRDRFLDRRYFRFPSEIHASFQLCDRHGVNLDENIHEGEIIDISENGFLIKTSPPTNLRIHELIERGTQVRLAILWKPDDVHALCKLRHVEVPARPEMGRFDWRMGVQMLDISAKDKETLHQVCKEAGESRLRNRTRSYGD